MANLTEDADTGAMVVHEVDDVTVVTLLLVDFIVIMRIENIWEGDQGFLTHSVIGSTERSVLLCHFFMHLRMFGLETEFF